MSFSNNPQAAGMIDITFMGVIIFQFVIMSLVIKRIGYVKNNSFFSCLKPLLHRDFSFFFAEEYTDQLSDPTKPFNGVKFLKDFYTNSSMIHGESHH